MDEERWPYPDVDKNSELGRALKRRYELGGDFGQLQTHRHRWEHALRETEERMLQARAWNYARGFDDIEALLASDESALDYAKLQARSAMLRLAIERCAYFIADLAPTVSNIESEVERLQARRRELERLLSQPGAIYGDRGRALDRRDLERELFDIVGDAVNVTTRPY